MLLDLQNIQIIIYICVCCVHKSVITKGVTTLCITFHQNIGDLVCGTCFYLYTYSWLCQVSSVICQMYFTLSSQKVTQK